jgi:hypothetical protein
VENSLGGELVGGAMMGGCFVRAQHGGEAEVELGEFGNASEGCLVARDKSAELFEARVQRPYLFFRFL